MQTIGKLKSAVVVLTTSISYLASIEPTSASCLDLRRNDTLSFEGTLTFRIFGGPPYNGGVTRGDTPEPSYILKLDRAICVTGDEFLAPDEMIDVVQVYPEAERDNSGAVSFKLRSLVGSRVKVVGNSAFGAHTGHHHAPLMLPITAVDRDVGATAGYGTAMTSIQGFYLALAAGDGNEAVRFLVPEKRSSGPLSAAAITGFYGRLREPLSLLNVKPTGPSEFRVRYTFVPASLKRCEGEAIVQTVRLQDENLISSIRTLNGC